MILVSVQVYQGKSPGPRIKVMLTDRNEDAVVKSIFKSIPHFASTTSDTLSKHEVEIENDLYCELAMEQILESLRYDEPDSEVTLKVFRERSSVAPTLFHVSYKVEVR